MLDYNTAIQTFPTVLIAGLLGFAKREFFDAEPEADQVPTVDLRLRRPGRSPRRPEDPWPRPSTARSPRTGGTRCCSSLGARRCSSARSGLAIGYGLTGYAGGRRRRARARARSSASSCRWRRTSRATRSSSRHRGAQAVTEEDAPQLMNVVRELTIAADIPMPKVYVIDDTAPNAFATGRDPKHASSRSRPACSRSSTARSSRASSATSCPTSATSTSASRCSSACSSAASRCWPTSSCASRSGAAAAAGRATTTGGGGGAPGDHLRRRDRPGHPRADRRPARPARGQPPARVPGRRVGGRADPQPVRARAGAGQDRGRPRRSSRSPTGRPSTCTSRTRSRSSRTRASSLFSTHPPIVDRINRLRAADAASRRSSAAGARAAAWPARTVGPGRSVSVEGRSRPVVSSGSPTGGQPGRPSGRDSSVGRARD